MENRFDRRANLCAKFIYLISIGLSIFYKIHIGGWIACAAGLLLVAVVALPRWTGRKVWTADARDIFWGGVSMVLVAALLAKYVL